MPKLIDLTGARFGKLVVLGVSKSPRATFHIRWDCRCDCGNTKSISGPDLRSGRTVSCGCVMRESIRRRRLKHGEKAGALYQTSGSREYRVWWAMHQRCENPRHANFKYYGARGIAVCARWSDFAAFLADMGRCPPGLTLDRIDNDGPYAPGNCRWATASQQNRNKRYRVAGSENLDGNGGLPNAARAL